MKTVGMMCVKDEADLLPLVYPHVRERVDYLYAYDDFSSDGTWDLIKYSDYAIRAVDDLRPDMARPNYHYLLEQIRHDFKGEDVWIFIAMGDRIFTKSPAEIVEEATTNAVEAIQVDCIKDDWTRATDPWPDYSEIQRLCTRFVYDEHCVVGYKLTDQVSYLNARYPWPTGLGPVQYKDEFHKDKPWLLHYGRRSPKGLMWRYASLSRPISSKYNCIWDLSTFESTVKTVQYFNGSKYGL